MQRCIPEKWHKHSTFQFLLQIIDSSKEDSKLFFPVFQLKKQRYLLSTTINTHLFHPTTDRE